MGGEEIHLCLQLSKRDWKIFYNPKAVIHHLIHPDRLNKSYFIDIAKAGGIMRVMWDHDGELGVCRFKQITRYMQELWRNLIRWISEVIRSRNSDFKWYLAIRSNISSIMYGLYLKYRYR